MSRPVHVELCEVGPRDGFQFEAQNIPTELKISLIRNLIRAGIPRIQVTSFVHPRNVPQMADAEQVVAALLDEPCTMTGLALNTKGVERAAASGLKGVDLSIATNEQHGIDNANMSVEEGVLQAEKMIRLGVDAGLDVQLNVQTVWGYRAPGDTPLERIIKMAHRFADSGLASFSLADSTGMANPDSIQEVIDAVRSVSSVPLVLHLHDTRGLGIANITAALEMGVDRFDTSLGGLGGCPFIPGATGNVATEDTVYLLDQLGIQHGIDNAIVAATSRQVSDFLERDLSGKMYRLY
ncbi:MAG: hydroxymethylglutaryl-CoA lyase [Bacteroidetes Order II. Incertae sedis bacterium]|nr:hydroxymethylglutaryl-CoA lyase [Bacteroidetes Order II. bacterium]MBT4601638.1 hydroxymethylglutaryl-CoA lyase [Bacteroidetes Order II. bacterium]MBT5249968.1 hydroxymethylglutaryl-CoA lyase [Bacteroidetes Order II. bacterium]MBT6425101.1 hydroxymethylglutaryl-CoA lyase [Bacteroidetes Order II. bacterium]MBT6580742.1 hydroxymethylglutaryl-CoA lyase [Bacteroidetes Order II. bacterium]